MILIDNPQHFKERKSAYKGSQKKVHLIAWDATSVYCGREPKVRLQTHELEMVTCGRCKLNLEIEEQKVASDSASLRKNK